MAQFIAGIKDFGVWETIASAAVIALFVIAFTHGSGKKGGNNGGNNNTSSGSNESA